MDRVEAGFARALREADQCLGEGGLIGDISQDDEARHRMCGERAPDF
jgi:hypothetical protein